MKKDNQTKKWIAVVIAVVLAIISLIAGSSKNKVEENAADEFMKQYTDKFTSIFDQYSQETIQGTNPNQRVMVVNVEGAIGDGPAYEAVMKDLEDARKDETIKAIIMNVNSPGGAVYNSEQIHNMILKIKEERKIPVYTVMETLAASGGYYISAPTDKIYASNDTFTGSIGVIMSYYSMQGLFEKYGIKQQNITSGAMKDAGTTGKDITEEQRQYLQGLVDSSFSRFVKVVAQGRGMSEDEVRKIADGRIYDGSQAVNNGLVDEIGDFEKALADIIKEAQLDDPIVFERNNYINNFSGLFSKASDILSTKSENSDLKILKELMEQGYPQPMYLYGE